MADKQFPLSVIIRAIDRITAPMGRIQRGVLAFDQRVRGRLGKFGDALGLPVLSNAAGKFGNALGDLGRRATRVAGAVAGITAAAVGLGTLAVRSLLSTAGEFERYRTILTTIEGSQKKAGQSVEWVSDFAAKTPYELGEVMDAFVKLRAYGIDPTDGTLRTLGDTAAAMGKPVMMAVEAIADAITGENERLKEFGIRAAKHGDVIVYEYSKDGKTMRKAARASNREMIRQTLMSIWNDRYAGAMDKLSGTYEGMMSNLSDQWVRFKLLVMQGGAFDWIRNKLSGLLAKIDAMAQSGELKVLAERVGNNLVRAFEALWRAGEKLVKAWPDIVGAAKPLINMIGWLVDKFGAGNVVIGALAGAITLYLVPAIAATVSALYALGVAMLATPIGWLITGIVALVGAIVVAAIMIRRNWEPISRWLGDHLFEPFFGALDMAKTLVTGTWDVIKLKFTDGIEWVVNKFTGLGRMLGGLVPDWVKGIFGGDANVTVGAAPAGRAVGAAAVGRAAGAQSGQARVQVDFNNLPRGTRVTSETSGRPLFELNQGYAMGYGE